MSKDLSPQNRPDLSPFNWEDPFLIETQPSEDQRMIRDSAHAYAQERLQPRVMGTFESENTDPQIFVEMDEMGLSGTTILEEHGGLGPKCGSRIHRLQMCLSFGLDRTHMTARSRALSLKKE